MVTCHLCPPADRQHYTTALGLQVHLANVHNLATPCIPFCETLCTLRNYTNRYELHLHDRDDDGQDVSTFFHENGRYLAGVLRHFGFPLRFYVLLKAELGRHTPEDEIIFVTQFIPSSVHTLWSERDVERAVIEVGTEVTNNLEKLEMQGSGFFLFRIHACILHVGRLAPQLIGCTDFELPNELKKKCRCLLNVDLHEDSEQNMCFAFCVLAGLHPAKGSYRRRASSYRSYLSQYVFPETFPVVFPKDVEMFEKQNDVSINVYGYDKDEKYVYPIKVVDDQCKKHVDLLLIDFHFVLITNFNALFTPPGYFHCKRCTMGFTTPGVLADHLLMCKQQKVSKTIFPKKGETLSFAGEHLMSEVPFYCVYDFESVLSPCSGGGNVYEEHIPSSFCLLVIHSCDSYVLKKHIYRGADCVSVFMELLRNLHDELYAMLHETVPLQMTPGDELEHSEATHCNICKEPFTKKQKVQDHDHVSGEFRQSLCQGCNLKLRIPRKVPIIAHNANYDLGFIVAHLHLLRKTDIRVIASSCQKFKAIDIGVFRFIDSLSFLNASLDTLTKNLCDKGESNFRCLRQFFAEEDYFRLVVRKGVFCYNYVTSFERYDEPCLPSRDQFFNQLNGSEVSEEDYRHAQNVFEKFQLKSLGEYSDLYLLTDALLLADVFQNFRIWALETHKIEPLHFVSLPGLSMSCALKMSRINLDLIHDPDAYLLIERGLRGGMTQCSTRMATANVPGTDQYDPEKPKTIIHYMDINGLYGTVMREPLPFGDFEWLSPEEVAGLDVTLVADYADVGYFLEVDLAYVQELHERHKDLPLAPEKMSVPYELLSDYQKDLMKKFNLPQHDIEPKLLLTLLDKKKYFLHYRSLKLYLQLGLRLEKIHRVLRFKQKPFLRSYVDFHHELRKQATNTFERNLYKSLINSVYGKTCMNVRKFVDCRLATSEEQVLRFLRKPNLKQFRALSSNVVLFQFAQSIVRMRQPLYLGFTILELSKVMMYDFYYNNLLRVAPDTRLLYMDTDSYIVMLSDEKALAELADTHLDTSGHSCDDSMYSTKNKMVLGKFKNEMPHDHILGFCCLKPKLYALDLHSKRRYNRAKGVKQCEAQKLHYSMYIDSLKLGEVYKVCQNLIVRKENINKSVCVTKVALNPLDTKRFICEDGIHTLPFGYASNGKM
ncbi:uncharacterized protein LOC135378445 [Ornithodoros turicata]|uniref:uncharacterized protein LOC135378445 n=1 Tax=Ornithodoros turicata TaxID=34597 RepID=UPI00313A3348